MAMFRAMIVDDEMKVCKLIYMLGDWERLSIEISGIYCDGEEALANIIEQQPDIVITDIRMPVYDGLELIRRSRNLGLRTAFIIVSGYRHFEYAHQAMQYGIVDYLLKPVSKEELNYALDKICQSLLERDIQANESRMYRKILNENEIKLHRDLLDSLAYGKELPADADSCNQMYQTEFTRKYYQVLIINTSLPQLHSGNTSFETKIQDIFLQVFDEHVYFFIVPSLKGFFCFLNYDSPQAATLPDTVTRLFHTIRGLNDIYGNFDLCISAGNTSEAYADLPYSFQTAVRYEQAKLLLGWNKVLSYLPISFTRQNAALISEHDFRILKDAFDILNLVQISDWFSSWKEKITVQNNINPASLYTSRDLLFSILPADTALDGIDNVSMCTDRARNIPDFINQICNFLLNFAREELESKRQQELYPIRQAKQFIQQHYADSLTLEQVASLCSFSPVYFSTVFKKETGQSFTDYLTQTRIDEAKKLLKNHTLSIIEISEAVGYTDNKYFRKLFKKYTGIRPSDYRKLYL